MVGEDPAEDKEDKELLAVVAHYIMVYYKKRRSVKKEKEVQAQVWAVPAGGRD